MKQFRSEIINKNSAVYIYGFSYYHEDVFLKKAAMENSFVKIIVFTPLTHADQVREALAKAGAGHIGHYDFCSFSSRGTGRFRPLKGSRPFMGKTNVIEMVEEEKIEVICPLKMLKKVLKEVKAVHPYEEPAIDVFPLVDKL